MGKTEPDASFSGMGKKGLASTFFWPFYLAWMELYLGLNPLKGVKLQVSSSSRLFDDLFPTEEEIVYKNAERPGLTNI